MKNLFLVIFFAFTIHGATFKSDTFPSNFIGRWVLIGGWQFGQYYPIGASESNRSITVARDSALVSQNGITYSFDSCDIDSGNINKIYLTLNVPMLLHGDSLTEMMNMFIPGTYDYLYKRSALNVALAGKNRCGKANQSYTLPYSKAVYNLMGQKISSHAVSRSTIRIKSNNPEIYLKK
jgi:hypothetical protein